MILSFSTKFPNGKPTYFIDKIWDSLKVYDLVKNIGLRYEYWKLYEKKFDNKWDATPKLLPKRHTIRNDEHNRWKPGMNIHFVINNRSKNLFQFAPVIECKSVQKIAINYLLDFKHYLLPPPVSIEIDGKLINNKEIEMLAQNDGFDSIADFLDWFNTDFNGKIIHWTDLKY